MMPVQDSRIAYVTVEHGFYGCESGCCGHTVYAYDASGNLLSQSEFSFTAHPYGDDHEGFARQFAEQEFPGAKLNLLESDVSDD